jgi:hypothetical protein
VYFFNFVQVALFLGAGASKIFEKPTTSEFKQILLEEVSPKNRQDILNTTLYFLLSHSIHPDIEYTFECVKNFKQFSNSEASKFLVNSKGTLVDEPTGLHVTIHDFLGYMNSCYNYLEQKLFQYYSMREKHIPLISEVYEYIFDFLKGFADEVNIFTTNYDTIIETFCEKNAYDYKDGFKYEPSSQSLKWNNSVTRQKRLKGKSIFIRLYKLHGSLTWKVHKFLGVIKSTGRESIDNSDMILENALIAPTKSPKDEETKEPFTTLIKEFKNKLMEMDVCIVIGFSFRDDNINEIFREFLNNGKCMITVSPQARKHVYVDLLNDKIPEIIVDGDNVMDSVMAIPRLLFIEDAITKDNVKNVIENFRRKTSELNVLNKQYKMLNSKESLTYEYETEGNDNP